MKIENLLTTDYIYIKVDSDMTLYVKDGNYVYKNDILMSNDIKKIYSSVSGKVLGLTTINNTKYIVIENDCKDKIRDKKYNKKNINNYTKEELVELIKKYNILNNFDESSKVLIINGIDLFNSELTYNILIDNYVINILDTIDALIDILNIRKCFLAVSNDNEVIVNNLVNNIGTYPKIDLKLYKNDNIIGIKEVLLKKLTSYKNKNYNVLYMNIIDIINLYNLMKKHIPVTTTFITLAGDLIDFKKVLHVNLGTNIKDILNEYNIENYNNIIINGLLNGKKIKDPNFIIDKNIRSIFINTEIKTNEVDCINCGLCLNVCSVNINPKYMHFNKDKKSKKYEELCIKCGMCSYICPSKIDLFKGE